jgi:hypothetical protein
MFSIVSDESIPNDVEFGSKSEMFSFNRQKTTRKTCSGGRKRPRSVSNESNCSALTENSVVSSTSKKKYLLSQNRDSNDSGFSSDCSDIKRNRQQSRRQVALNAESKFSLSYYCVSFDNQCVSHTCLHNSRCEIQDIRQCKKRSISHRSDSCHRISPSSNSRRRDSPTSSICSVFEPNTLLNSHNLPDGFGKPVSLISHF